MTNSPQIVALNLQSYLEHAQALYPFVGRDASPLPIDIGKASQFINGAQWFLREFGCLIPEARKAQMSILLDQIKKGGAEDFKTQASRIAQALVDDALIPIDSNALSDYGSFLIEGLGRSDSTISLALLYSGAVTCLNASTANDNAVNQGIASLRKALSPVVGDDRIQLIVDQVGVGEGGSQSLLRSLSFLGLAPEHPETLSPAELALFYSAIRTTKSSAVSSVSGETQMISTHKGMCLVYHPRINQGSMARVYRGRWGNGVETQDVAIKMVNVDREKNPDLYALVVQRFEREAKVLELLSGVPYMMRLVDHGSDSLLVCSLVEGESLMNFSREKMMVKDQAQLALKIVDALMGAHQRGIVHGDVNSTNLMVADNSPVFIDFNLAQNYPPTAQGFGGKFSRKAFEGAPGYLAPEMFLGKSVGQSVDLTWENAVQVDVYGLGAVLYHLFTGYIPYMGLDFVRDLLSQEAFQEAVNEEDRRRKLFKHVAELMNAWGTVTNPADVNYELPIEIGNIILELLNKNPSNRPSLLQVKKVLSHWVETSDSFEAVA